MSKGIVEGIRTCPLAEVEAYIAGCRRDAYWSRLHNTLRVSQKERDWLSTLQVGMVRMGHRSWIYREGSRDVWTLETSWSPPMIPRGRSVAELRGFIRGYFDSEGGVPRDREARFYIQMCQKDKGDLEFTRACLEEMGISCGTLHNPSRKVDSRYWRFYVRSCSHRAFFEGVGSWHPRKSQILLERFGLPDRRVL